VEKLNFDAQRLPPFLVGYLIDGKVGEREIVATIIQLAVKGDLFIMKKDGEYLIGRAKPGMQNPDEIASVILKTLPRNMITLKEAMGLLRQSKDQIYNSFIRYIMSFHKEITKKKSRFVFFNFSLRMTAKANDDDQKSIIAKELSGNFNETRILPNLPESDMRSLLDLVDFLNRFPADPANIASEYLPYRIAMGQDSFWTQRFGADLVQRTLTASEEKNQAHLYAIEKIKEASGDYETRKFGPFTFKVFKIRSKKTNP